MSTYDEYSTTIFQTEDDCYFFFGKLMVKKKLFRLSSLVRLVSLCPLYNTVLR